ncbi:MAG: response regulator [Chitinivibrionales bacterium]|nr:response regulator [Chitinivibrionales bacterium]
MDYAMNTLNNGKHLLLVDDEEAIIFALKRVLRRPRVTIDTAGTLEDAKSCLDTAEYDALVADMRLTGSGSMEGFEIVAYARNHQDHCKILVITAFGDDEIREKVFNLGADVYLEKPVSPRTVSDMLESIGVFSKV